MRPGWLFVIALVWVLPAQQQPAPVFRARVDLVTVDVAVVDNDGRPVNRLVPADFTVVAGNRPRKIVAADFVSVEPNRSRSTATVASVPAPSSNSTPATGRSFLFVVDVEHIAAGGGRGVLKSIGEYLEKLRPDDRVGMVVLPFGTPRVDLTTNRQLIQDAAAKIAGVSTRNQGGSMTVGEAAAVEQMDSHALDDYLQRVNVVTGSCDLPTELLDAEMAMRIDPSGTTCLMKMQPAANWIMEAERRKTRDLLDSLEAIASAMTSIDGPKSIVLVSEGIVIDRNTINELRRFSLAAERARVTFFALNLPMALADVGSRYNMTTARMLDQKVLFDGMSMLAVAGRGEAFMISGTPLGALARIDGETSGYYLVSFERDAQDRDGDRQKIDVRVNWPGATVRARTDFTVNPEPPPVRVPADLKVAIGQVLRWPVATTDLGVDLDTYSAPDLSGRDAIRTVVAASFAAAGRPMAAVGYEVSDAAGKTVADGFESDTLATDRLAGDRVLYLAAVNLPKGAYRVKLAGITADGRQGSVEHEFEVAPARLGGVRLSDVFLGEIGSKGFVPNPWVLPGAATLPVSLEVYADSPDAFKGAVLTLELAPLGRAPLARLPLSQKPGNDPRRQLASATLAIASLPPGPYTVTAVLQTADGAAIRSSRVFNKR